MFRMSIIYWVSVSKTLFNTNEVNIKMKEFLITGGTGLVGSHLVDAIHSTDSHITILTRQDRQNLDDKITYVNWSKEGWEDKVPDHIDIVINLAGASLNKRWTDEYKQTLMLSRIQATQSLYELFEHKGKFPGILFNASAVGYYTPDVHRTYTELSKCDPHDFLSDITYQWERFARKFEQHDTRVIIGRFGMVLSDEGGALPTMELPYRFYLGGKLGTGFQWYSWIHITDLTRAILFLINQDDASGVFNMTTPIAERQNLFGYVLARAMHKPHELWVPSALLRLVLGQRATIILDTQKAIPNRLDAYGFKFAYPDLKSALDSLVHE